MTEQNENNWDEVINSKENIIQSAINAGISSTVPDILNKELKESGFKLPEHLVVSDRDLIVTSFERYLERPLSKTGTYTFAEIMSFNDFINKHKVEGETVIQAFEDKGEIVCCFNDHSGKNPGRKDFRAILGLMFSESWKIWTLNNKKSLSQTEFADFIEDNRLDFMAGEDETGKKNITAVELMAMVVNLQETKTYTFGSKVNRHDGTYEFVAKNTKDGNKTQIKVPNSFMLAIPIFKGGTLRKVNITCRYRNDEDKGLFFYFIIDNKDKILRDAFDKLRKQVKDGNPSDKPGLTYAGTAIEVWA